MIKVYFKNTQKMLELLIVASAIMLISMVVSMFMENAKIMGSGMLVWIFVLFLNLRLTFINRNLTVGDLVNHIHKQELEAKKDKKHLERGVYAIVVPLMIIGLIFVVLILIAFFTIL